MTSVSKIAVIILPPLAFLAATGFAAAQLQLPGASRSSTPAGTTTTPSGPAGGARPKSGGGSAEPATPKPVMVRAPSERSLEGRTLALNGRTGVLRFTGSGDKLELVEIRLTGDKLSKVGESCSITVPGGPFRAEKDGRSEGLVQFRVEAGACPFSFAVLDGAVMVTHRGSKISTGLGAGTCEIQAEDCRGYLAGFWGPPGSGIGAAEAKGIEATRGDAEKNARANFRNLIRNARSDRNKTRELAADQAGFSARREEVCRDYVREHQHGFCASRYTQARAVALAAQLGAVEIDDGSVKPVAPKPRPKKPAAPRPAPGAAQAGGPGGAAAPLQPVLQ